MTKTRFISVRGRIAIAAMRASRLAAIALAGGTLISAAPGDGITSAA